MASVRKRTTTGSGPAIASPAVLTSTDSVDNGISKQSPFSSATTLIQRAITLIQRILTDRSSFISVAIALLVFEIILSLLIIRYQGYTEIDWRAYMDEVRGVIVDGEFDYKQLRGDTGPLVYPAGFVWLYSILYYITDNGTNILLAQYIFALLYIIFTGIIFIIYYYTLTPPYLLIFLILSKRIHSIFMLRCFNDCFAMFFLYFAIVFLIKNKWFIGVTMINIGISIKMNILLFLPAIGILLLERFRIDTVIYYILFIILFQIFIGLPFILTYPISYFTRAFEFSRQFFYIWTVNYKYINEDIFLHPHFSLSLLIGHLVILSIVLHCLSRYGILTTVYNSLTDLLTILIPKQNLLLSSSSLSSLSREYTQLSANHIVQLLFITNFIGIAFARSLHYQFYVWYFHTLPLITYIIGIPIILQIIILFMIEIAFNVYPSVWWSSLMLTIAHAIIIIYIIIYSWERYQIREQAKLIGKEK